MADVTAIFGILLFLGFVYPGMLLAWWLLFPNVVQRAQTRIEHTPWRSFWLGLGLTMFFSIPIVILLALPYGPAKLVGFSIIVLLLGIATLGAAGLAARMGDALIRRDKTATTQLGAFLRGAIALEFAGAFPLIGWFIFLPLSSILALGASAFAILRWIPTEENQQNSPTDKSRDQPKEMRALTNDVLVS